MNSLLVTGGAGFIGRNFVRYMLQTYPDVRLVNVDALTYAGNLENLEEIVRDPRYSFVKADICDRTTMERVVRTHGVDSVVHFGAESHVDRSILGAAAFVPRVVHAGVVEYQRYNSDLLRRLPTGKTAAQ